MTAARACRPAWRSDDELDTLAVAEIVEKNVFIIASDAAGGIEGRLRIGVRDERRRGRPQKDGARIVRGARRCGLQMEEAAGPREIATPNAAGSCRSASGCRSFGRAAPVVFVIGVVAPEPLPGEIGGLISAMCS
jgi:hypothetical protein